MNYFKSSFIPLMFLSVSLSTLGQTLQPDVSNRLPKPKFDSFVNRPDLGVALASTTKFKIALRKSTYRRGEMIVLDTAMFTSGDGYHYFPRMDTLVIQVEDKTGRKIDVNPFVIADSYFSPLFLKGELELHSLDLIVGCRSSDLSFPAGIDDAESDEEIFDRSLFITKGDACINIPSPGSYKISVELSNQWVVIPDSGSIIKTAVGKIQSNTLPIFIRE